MEKDLEKQEAEAAEVADDESEGINLVGEVGPEYTTGLTDDEVIQKIGQAADAEGEGTGEEGEGQQDVEVGMAVTPMGRALVTIVVTQADGTQAAASVSPDEAYVIAGNLSGVGNHILAMGLMQQMQEKMQMAQIGRDLTQAPTSPGGVHLPR